MSYHGLTFGTLLGRTIEGATGKPFAQVLHDEVTSVALMKNARMPGRAECHTWELVLRATCEGRGIAYEASPGAA